MAKEFVHLHVHSEFSLLRSSSRVSDLVLQAREFGMPGLAITDRGNMFGAVAFFREAKKLGIKPILGTEVFFTTGLMDTKKIPDPYENYSRVLLAKTTEGYQNLMKLSSLSWNEGYHFIPRLDQATFESYSKDLIMILPRFAGKITALLENQQRNDALYELHQQKDLLGEGNLYLEVLNRGLPGEIELNQRLRELSQESGVPLVATNDSFYTHQSDGEAHEILMAIDEKMTLTDPRRPQFPNREFYFKSSEQMLEAMHGFEDACENTLVILDDCNVELKFDKLFLPQFEVPADEDENSFLESECRGGIPKHYAESNSQIEERLKYELDVIKEMGFASYFLIVSDFIHAARAKGIPVGPGRGSAAGSIVSYLLGITNIDPLAYGLYFERFLNPARISMPDIDIDFCYRRRDEVIQYVKEKYGQKRVAQIITFGTLKAKAVLKDVSRVLEIPFEAANEISKSIPDDAKNLADALENSLEVQRWRDQYEQLFSAALKLEGLPRHTGIHAAGVVIAPEELSRYVPLAGQREDNDISTQYDGVVLESQGLLKMDFLGLSTLTVIQDTLDHIQKNRCIELDLDKIPLDDEESFELLSSSYTAGLFQVDSPLFRGIITKMQPRCFEDVIALVALGRPGPLESGMVDIYCQSRKDESAIEYPHEKLEDLLKETFGVILYQEQVMNCAVILADYSMAQADELRKAMGKKIKADIQRHRDLFVEGAVKNGIDTTKADEIYNMIDKFGRYGFNKSHSAAYGLICYQTTFLKTHYPQEFMAAALTDKIGSQNQQEHVKALIDDCERMGIEIRPPDVNHSTIQFGVDGDAIIFGLGAVKDVGEKATSAIEKARNPGGFTSFRDFCYSVDLFTVNKKVIESLVRVGALDGIAGNRDQKLKVIESTIHEGQELQKNRKSGQKFLFEAGQKTRDFNDDFDADIEASRVEHLVWEKELTGVYFSGHPLDEYRTLIDHCNANRCRELSEVVDGTQMLLGGIISGFRRRVTKNGEDWITFRLSDYSGTVDCVVFAGQFKKVTFKVLNDQVVYVQGERKIQQYNGKPQIIINSMECADFLHESVKWKLQVQVHLQGPNLKKELVDGFRQIASKHGGKHGLQLYYQCQGYQVELRLPDEFKIKPDVSCIQEMGEILGTDPLRFQITPPESRFSHRRRPRGRS